MSATTPMTPERARELLDPDCGLVVCDTCSLARAYIAEHEARIAAEASRDAAVTAALREAANAVLLRQYQDPDERAEYAFNSGIERAGEAILALIRPEASAALDRLIAGAEARGMERAADIAFAHIASEMLAEHKPARIAAIIREEAAILKMRSEKIARAALAVAEQEGQA